MNPNIEIESGEDKSLGNSSAQEEMNPQMHQRNRHNQGLLLLNDGIFSHVLMTILQPVSRLIIMSNVEDVGSRPQLCCA